MKNDEKTIEQLIGELRKAHQCILELEHLVDEQQAQLKTHFEVEENLQEENVQLNRRVTERTGELSRANQDLEMALSAKCELLSKVNHQLRTPLSAILGMSEILQEQSCGSLNEKQLGFIQTIEESGQRQLSLIEDVSDLSELEAGRFTPEIDKAEIETICRNCLQDVEKAAAAKKIEIALNLDYSLPAIQVDESRLKHILDNLLDNAIHFTEEGGKVGLEVAGDAKKGVIRFEVWDTGVGIADEELGRIFLPFERGEEVAYSEGSGLGLTLAWQLADGQGGSVSVESAVGKGSRFTVTLPWQEARERGVKGSLKSPVAKHVQQASELVLLAEDLSFNVQLLSGGLTSQGYNVAVVHSGSRAVEYARKRNPDVCLIDLQMPVVDGLETIRRMRVDSELSSIPVVALASLELPGARERCLRAGADAYLLKPINPDELSAAIETLV